MAIFRSGVKRNPGSPQDGGRTAGEGRKGEEGALLSTNMPRREKEAAVTSLIPLSHKSLAPTQNTAPRFLIRHTSSNLSQRGQKKTQHKNLFLCWVKACGALFAASPFFNPLPSYARFTLTAVHRPVNSYEEEYLLGSLVHRNWARVLQGSR